MNRAVDMIIENRAERDIESKKEVKKIVLTAKRSLSDRMDGADMLYKRWTHNPMSMNYKAMGITSEELK